MMHFLPLCEKAADVDTPKLLRIIEKELRALLTLEPTGYWETHFDFGTGGARKSSLIGDARAVDIIINKILPVAYVWAVESDQSETTRGDPKTLQCRAEVNGQQDHSQD